jgi:hypothetical protein
MGAVELREWEFECVGLKENSYEHKSGYAECDDGERVGQHHDWAAQRAESEQYVFAIAGGAAAEPGSDQSGRSFDVRGAVGAVQRTERGDFDL